MALEIPSGSITLMHVNTAPPGWTKLTAQNACALRVVTGSASTGGVQNVLDVLKNHPTNFTPVNPPTTVDPVTLTAPQLPGHSHRYSAAQTTASRGNTSIYPGPMQNRLGLPSTPGTSNTLGGAGSHTHPLATGFVTLNQPGTPIQLLIKYVDIILVQRQ